MDPRAEFRRRVDVPDSGLPAHPGVGARREPGAGLHRQHRRRAGWTGRRRREPPARDRQDGRSGARGPPPRPLRPGRPPARRRCGGSTPSSTGTPSRTCWAWASWSPTGSLPPDDAIGDERFVSNVHRPVQGSDVDRYADAGREPSPARRPTDLPALLGCDPAGANEATCVGRLHRELRQARLPPPADAGGGRAGQGAARGRPHRRRRWPTASACWSRPCCSRRASSTWSSPRPRPRWARWSRWTAGRWPRACRTSSSTACPTTSCSRPPRPASWPRPTRWPPRPPG